MYTVYLFPPSSDDNIITTEELPTWIIFDIAQDLNKLAAGGLTYLQTVLQRCKLVDMVVYRQGYYSLGGSTGLLLH